MTSWQKHVRRVLAVFFVAFAAYVYLSLRDRPALSPPADVQRLDPDVVSQTTGGSTLRLSGLDRKYDIDFESQVVFDDGSARLEGPVITVEKEDGRIYVLTADRALIGPDQIEGEATGNVRLRSDDGFGLVTTRALFTEGSEIVLMPEPVTFTRGRMRGSGNEASYDHANDVLTVFSDATVTTTDDRGAVTLDGTAGRATLDRMSDRLLLDGDVHVTREGQVTRADEAVAYLSAEEDSLTRLELRGAASVEGGSGRLQSMAARNIDLDYTDDGASVEHAVLDVDAAIVLTGADGSRGQRLAGDRLDLRLAADGSILEAEGIATTLELPPDGDAPSRRIRSDEFSASGKEGRGLTRAVFRRDVEYREGADAVPDRQAFARLLTIELLDDAIGGARFERTASFEAGPLTAAADTIEYDPARNRLLLRGADTSGDPRLIDAQKEVQAGEIEVGIDTQDLTATGEVRTSLRADSSDGTEGGRLPGLLDAGDPMSVNAARLDYTGDSGRAVYSGGAAQAVLWQGDVTMIRAGRIAIDRRTGDLVATGNASARIALDGDTWRGEADEIRYDEATRTVFYSRSAVEPTTGRGVTAGTPPPLARLHGGTRDLRGRRIDVVLTDGDNGIARLEAYTDVTLVLGDRRGRGARLTHDAAGSRYEISGTPSAPAVFCDGSREWEGGTLTYFESTDTIAVDGHTRRSSARACSAPVP